MMLDNYPNDFTALQIHIFDGSYDTTWGNARKAFYGVGGTPTIWFDSTLGIEGTYGSASADYTQYRSRYLTRKNVATDVNITLSAEPIASQTYHVSALVGIESSGAGKTMRVHIAQVLDNWPTSPSYSRNTFKQASAYQDVYVAAGGWSFVEADFTVDATSWTNRDDIIFVAWAQKTGAPPSNSEVYQAAFLKWPFPFDDCNDNDIPDLCDTDCGASLPDGVPCTEWPGCGGSFDSNDNGIPDECEMYTVPAGDDCGTTACGAAQVDFASQPLPADFFGPGSDPFDGIITLGNQDGDADTVVTRLDVMNFMYPLPSEQVVPIELTSLNLVGCEPIEVPGFGLWDVQMTLSATAAPQGTLTATKTHGNGGTYESVFYVQPVYTFTQLDPPYSVAVWDTGAQSIPPFEMHQVADGPWSDNEFCESCDEDGYIQGIDVDEDGDGCAVQVCFAADGFTHCVMPPGCPACLACCLPDGSCTRQDGAAGCTDAGGWANEPGSTCAGDGDGSGIDDACEDDACTKCGPGDHWIDSCEGSVDHLVALATVVMDFTGNCQPDFPGDLEGLQVVSRTDPLDDSIYLPGSAPVDGHLEVIDTEMTYLEMTGPSMTLRAGQNPNLTYPANHSFGTIVEQVGDPALANQVIDAYLEVTVTGWFSLYNVDPVQLTAVVDCAASRTVYSWEGCTPVYTNPDPEVGTQLGNILSITIETFPSDCPDNPTFDAYPPDGTVDARKPHPNNAATPLYGIGMPDDAGTVYDESSMTPIVIDLGVTGADADCFTLCEVPAGNNAIAGVTEDAPGLYTIALAHGCVAGAVTTIQYNGGDYVSYLHHPANADGSDYANANDITVVVNCLNTPGSCQNWQADLDFSGSQTANDIVEVVDLLNGAGLYAPGWYGTPVPENDGSCP